MELIRIVRLVCVAGVATVVSSPSIASRIEDAPPRLSLQPPARLVGEAGLRKATLNIVVYAEKHKPNGPLARLLENVEVMDVEDAATDLARLERDRGGLHHRIAVIALLHGVPHLRGVREAVAILIGADATLAIYGELDLIERAPRCDAPDWEREQRRLIEVLNRRFPPGPYKNCGTLEAVLGSTFDAGDNSVGIVTKVLGTASVDSAIKGIDAQRWESCSSSLWNKAYLVSVDAAGTIEDNGGCANPQGPDCMPMEGAAEAWDKSYDTGKLMPHPRPLFEYFVCDGGWCNVRLLLRIVTDVDQSAVRPDYAYSLAYSEPKPWKNFAWAKIDHGSVTVLADGTPSPNTKLEVEASKTFGFDSWGTNEAVGFMLKRLEMGWYLADLACCAP